MWHSAPGRSGTWCSLCTQLARVERRAGPIVRNIPQHAVGDTVGATANRLGHLPRGSSPLGPSASGTQRARGGLVSPTTPNSCIDDEPDGQCLARGDGHCLAGLFGIQARGRRADQVGAGCDSQFKATNVIGHSGGHDVTVLHRFHRRLSHWPGVWFVRKDDWTDRASVDRSLYHRCGKRHAGHAIAGSSISGSRSRLPQTRQHFDALNYAPCTDQEWILPLVLLGVITVT